MAQEDEMSLPYLVFRTWREYYDSLCLVEKLLTNNEYERARAQMVQAEAFLKRAKNHLLQRGMYLNDTHILDINAALSDHHAQNTANNRELYRSLNAMLERADQRKREAAELL